MAVSLTNFDEDEVGYAPTNLGGLLALAGSDQPATQTSQTQTPLQEPTIQAPAAALQTPLQQWMASSAGQQPGASFTDPTTGQVYTNPTLDNRPVIYSGGLPASTPTQTTSPAVTAPPAQTVGNLQGGYGNATYDVRNVAGITPDLSSFGTVPIDPSVFSGTPQTTFGVGAAGGLQGTQFSASADPGLKNLVQSAPDYEIQKNLSDLLKNNQFQEAVKYAQEKGVIDYLSTPSVLRNLREPFTKNEAAEFLRAMPAPTDAASIKYSPESAIASSIGQWDSETGYPGYGGGLYREASVFDNLMANLVNAAIIGSAGYAGHLGLSALTGAGAAGASGAGAAGAGEAAGVAGAGAGAGATGTSALSAIPAAVKTTALRSAVGNAAVTAIRGGDIGDILKSAAIGGATGGLSAAAAPHIFSSLISNGLSPELAKAATNSMISAGVAAVKGGNPLLAAASAGVGTYFDLQAGKIAEFLKIPPDVAVEIAGPTGAALTAWATGQDPLKAGVNQYLNQYANRLWNYARDNIRDALPDSVVDSFDNFKEWLKSHTSFDSSGGDYQKIADVSSQTDKGTQGGLDQVTVSGSKLGDIGAYNLLTGLGGAGSKVSTGGDGLQEVTVGGNKLTGDQAYNLLTGLGGAGVTTGKDGLEEVTVGGNKLTDDQAYNLLVNNGGLDEVKVTGTKVGDDAYNLLVGGGGGNTVTTSDDGLQEVVVGGTKIPPKTPDIPLGPIVVDTTIPDTKIDKIIQPPASTLPKFNVFGSGSGGAGALAGGAGTNQEFLDSMADFLTSRKVGEGVKLAALQQIYPGLDPSMASMLVQRLSPQAEPKASMREPIGALSVAMPPQGSGGAYQGYGSYLGARGGEVHGYSDAGTVKPDEKPSKLDNLIADLKGFAPEGEGAVAVQNARLAALSSDPKWLERPSTEPEFLRPTMQKQRKDVLRKVLQLNQVISPYWSSIYSGHSGDQPMARGGLPSAYHEAAPDGHNPEFITGLTGYYAQGGGTGQSDDIPAMLHDGDYVMDAEAVSALGDGSSKAGAEVLAKMQSQIPYKDGHPGKPVPAKIADGEYVFPAAFVTALGGGDNKRGASILDGMREKLRAHKRSAPLNKIPPKAKSPLQYMKGSKG